MNKSLAQVILKENRTQDHISLLTLLACQSQSQNFDIGQIQETYGQIEIVPANIKQLLEFNQNLQFNRKQLYPYNKLLFLPIMENHSTIFFLDITGQIVLTLTYGDQDKKLIMSFRVDDMNLIQELVVKYEYYLNEKNM